MSEDLRTAKIPSKEGVWKYRVHIRYLFRKKRVSEHLRCPNMVISRIHLLKKEQVYLFFFFFFGGGGGGGEGAGGYFSLEQVY